MIDQSIKISKDSVRFGDLKIGDYFTDDGLIWKKTDTLLARADGAFGIFSLDSIVIKTKKPRKSSKKI